MTTDSSHDMGPHPGSPTRQSRTSHETRTEIGVTESGYASEEVAATSRDGMQQCLDKMAATFAGRSA